MPFPQRVQLLFGSLRPSEFGTKFPVLLIRDFYPGSWIPDPNYFHSVSQILDQNFFHPGSLIPDLNFFPSRILDPGCALKNSSILTKKMVSQLSEIWSEFYIPDPDPESGYWLFTYPGSQSWIPDPESRDQKGTGSLIPDPGSGFATLEILGLLRL